MLEKLAIATLNYGYEENKWYQYMRDVFVPSIRDYAKRINVDFILMNKNNDRMCDTWNQLQFLDYLKYYDRVMYIDGDFYIPKYFTYNYFEHTPTDKIGLYIVDLENDKMCNFPFIVMILNKYDKDLFIPPSIYEQKYNYCFNSICLLDKNKPKNKHFQCYCDNNPKEERFTHEECYINICINRYNLKDRIHNLGDIIIKKRQFFLTQGMITDKTNKCMYHLNMDGNSNIPISEESIKILKRKIKR